VLDGLLVSADRALKNELMSVPSVVELAEEAEELNPKIFSTCCRADWRAPD
jgi:hypothetical protein